MAAAAIAALAAGCGSGAPAAGTAGDGIASAPEVTDPQGWHGVPLDDPVDLPDVVLTDTAGKPFDLRAETLGDPTLLFFGYTHCPDICPIHMSTIARAMETTGVDTSELDVVFVTNDPDRDTPEVLDDFLGRFHPGFVGLTGPLDRIVAAMETMDLPAPVITQELDDGGYIVGHPAQVLAFDEDGVARMAYPFGVRMSAWTADLPKIVAGEEPRP